MTNVPMPEPVAVIAPAYALFWASGDTLTRICERTGAKVGSLLITTTQAEAYADARVREALEAALREMVELAADTRANKELVAHESWIANCAANRIRALIK